MHYYEVAPNKIIRQDSNTFTYSSDQKLQLGQIVSVEVGKKQVTGVVIKQTKKPIYNTKPIKNVIENNPLPIQLVKLALWMSEYYISPLATTLQSFLPSGILKKRKDKTIKPKAPQRNRTNILFNNDQTNVKDTLDKDQAGTYLLHGVTGSGKTEIYIDVAKKCIASNKSAIILVPEISLTSQLIAEFSNHFDNIIATHSKMTESERHKIWLTALNSSDPMVIIGPRSALFLPISSVGVIVIDECHDSSYKQEKSPKYSALRLATMLGRFHDAQVIFGSATPSIIDYYLANNSEKPILKLDKVARQDNYPPDIHTIDMTKRENFKKHRFLSDLMLHNIEKSLKNNQQALIFHNRRGSTNLTMCKKCGWTADCPNCFVPMSLHIDKSILQCHICGQKQVIPKSCPTCYDIEIIHKGIGTKLIESELKKLFPKANIARFDADNKADETVQTRYNEIYNGSINIIIGTQIIAKGLDLPHLGMVGIVQADIGLAIPDYNSEEKIFQLVSQVIGRVGRNNNKTSVVVQTYQINNKNILYGLKQDYQSFYNDTIEKRRQTNFPPFSYLLKVSCSYKTESDAVKNIKKIYTDIKKNANNNVTILGPSPAFYERKNNKYNWQIIIKSPKREHLIEITKLIPKNNFQFDIDPASLL